MTEIGGQSEAGGEAVSQDAIAAQILTARGATPPADAQAAPAEKPAEDGAPAESTLEQRIEEAKAALAEDDKGEKATGTEQKPAKGRSPTLQKLIDEKYGGDEDALVSGLWDQWNSSAKLHERLERLDEKLSSREQRPIEEHPDIQALSAQFAATEQRGKAIENRRLQFIRDIGSLDMEVASKQGELKRAEDYEKPDLRAEIRDLQGKRERYLEKLESLEHDDAQLAERKETLAAKIEQAKEAIEEAQSREAEAKAADAQLRVRTLSDFEESFVEAVAALQIPKEKQRRLYSGVRAELALQIRAYGRANNDRAVPPEAIRKATRAIVEGYAKDLGLSAKDFAALSKAKAQGTTTLAPKGTSVAEAAAAPSTGRGAEWTLEQSRAHARRVFRGY